MTTAMRIELTDEGRRALRVIERRWGRAELFRAVDRVFEREAQLLAADSVRKFLSGDPLARRTGSLARSVVGQSIRVNGIPTLAVGVFRGPALRYAAIQEFGTKGKGGLFPTIRPKKAKSLAIPQKSVLTAAGVPRYDSPLRYPGKLRFVLARKGNLVGFLVDADDESDEPLWMLVRKVDIRPKRYLRDAMAARLPKIGISLSNQLARLLGGERVA